MNRAIALALALVPAAAPGADRAPLAPGAASRPAPAAEIARALEDLACDDWILQYRAIRQLAAWKSRQAREPLAAVVAGRGGPWVRGRALVALAEVLGEEVLDAALHHARGEQPELRAAAVEALGLIGSPKGDGVAAAALGDNAPEVREQAVLAVARLRKAAAWPVVQPLLKESDPKLLRCAAEALRCVGTDDARQALRPLLDHADALVRLEAVTGLGQFRNVEDVECLLKRLAGDESTFVRQKAQESLASYPPEVLRRRLLDVLKAPEAGCDAAAVSVLALAADRETCDAVAAMVRAAGGRYKEAIRPILSLLGGADPDRYQDLLTRYLADPSTGVRLEAARRLAQSRKADLFAVLQPLLTDKSSSVRVHVLSLLADKTSGQPAGGILAYLAAPLRDETWEVRKQAVELLARRVKPAELAAGLGSLDRVLGSADAYHRGLAAEALSRVGDEETQRLLAAAQGYVTEWRVIGPFPNDKENRGFATVWPPERLVDFARACPEWRMDGSAAFEVVRSAAGRAEALRIAPPSAGRGARTVAAYVLDLPAGREVRASMGVSRAEKDAQPGAVAVSVRAGEKVLAARKLLRPGDANSLDAPLTGLTGKRVELELVVEALDQEKGDAVVVSRPRVLSDGKTVADLAELGATAPVRTEAAGGSTRKLQWEPYRIPSASGELALHDIFPPPTHYHVAYAAAELDSDADRAVVLEIAADDACAVWLNGAEVSRQGDSQPTNVRVSLRKGPNRLLVKVANLVDWWQCSVRVVDGNGRRAEGVHVAQP